MNIHIHHHVGFDEGSPFVKLVKAVDQNVRLLLHRTGVIMAQLDDLLATLNAISSDVDTTLSQVSALETQLTNLQNSTPASVDLSSAISLAGSIRQRLEGTQQAVSDAAAPATVVPAAGDVPPTAPEAPPPSDGSTGTGE